MGGEGVPGEGSSPFHHTPLRNLMEVVQQWLPADPMALLEDYNFAMHIGNTIEGGASEKQNLEDLQQFQKHFDRLRPLLTTHVVGDTTFKVYGGRRVAEELLDIERAWYALSEASSDGFSEGGAYHVLCIDCYDEAKADDVTSGWERASASVQYIDAALAAADVAKVAKIDPLARPPPVTPTSEEGPRRLAISPEQLLWVQERLIESQNDGTAVLVVSHRPLVPTRGQPGIPILADLLMSFRRTIRLCISADSAEGFHINVGGTDHIGLETMSGTKAYGSVEVHPDCVFINGQGRMTTRVVPKQPDGN